MKILAYQIVLLLFFTLTTLQTVTINNYGCRAFNDNGSCQQCSTRYYLDQQGICQPVNPNCKDYNSLNGACLNCYDGFQIVQTTCLPNSLFGSSADVNCNQYQNGICMKCSQGYYFNANRKCTQVDTNCKTYNQLNGFCLSCYGGYVLNISKCDIQVVQLDPFCRSFLNNTCLQCSQGYYFNSQRKCTQINDNCKTFNLQTLKCQDCYQGYQLNSINQCFRSTNNPDSALCRVWLNNSCQQCSQGAYFNNNGICTLIDPLCKTFDFNGKRCAGCYNGYRLDSLYNCMLGGNTIDPFCRTFSNGTCTQCSFRYFMNSNKRCELVDPLCKEFSAFNGNCTSCYIGYRLVNGNCLTDLATDSLCAQYSGSNCIRCSFGAYFGPNGYCVTSDPLCKTFDNLTGSCTSCYVGYKINASKCIIDDSYKQKDPYCAQFLNGVCQQCSKGYYFDSNRKCIQSDPLCKTYNQITGECLSCYIGYQLANKKCIVPEKPTNPDPNCLTYDNLICTTCLNRYFIGSNGICQAVNILCKDYLQNGICTSCYIGTPVNGICNNTSTISNCETVAQSGETCLKCVNGYQVNFNGGCTSQDVLLTCLEYTNGICTKCVNFYALLNGLCVLF